MAWLTKVRYVVQGDVVAERIKEDIQKRVTDAGIEVIELVSHT